MTVACFRYCDMRIFADALVLTDATVRIGICDIPMAGAQMYTTEACICRMTSCNEVNSGSDTPGSTAVIGRKRINILRR